VKPPLPQRPSFSSRDGLPSSQALRAALGPIAPRDTDATPFTEILGELLRRVPGAYAAALVDSQGETVDYTGRGDPFDLRVAAAHLQLVLQGIARLGVLGAPSWVVVRGELKSVAASVLPDGYALGLLLRSRSAFTISTRALRVCVRALAAEAGWPSPELGMQRRSWFAVGVDTDRRGRPVRVAGTPVEILGAVIDLPVRERGFRVRTQSGTELMLVREPGNRWYADEDV
jgi:hypothetical protein